MLDSRLYLTTAQALEGGKGGIYSENAGGGGGEDAVVLATPHVMQRIRAQLQRMV